METEALSREEKQFTRMTETPTMRLVCSLAIPTVASMLVTSVYNLADTFFVSQLGTAASGAVSIVFSLQTLIQAIGFGLGMGAGSLVSLCLGKKQNAEADKYASSAFAAALLFGTLLMAVCLLFLEDAMRLFGANDDILPYACAYSQYILLGAPLMCSTFVLNIVLRTSGRPQLSMVGIMAGAILNIILDPIFILDFGLGLGIAGAAIATLTGQVVSFLVLLYFYVRHISLVNIAPKYVSRQASTYGEIISTGIPTVCRQGIASLATMLLNNEARLFGSAAIAAMGIANRIYMFIRSIVIGIGQGMQPVVGYNYGAGKYGRVREAFRDAVLLSTAVTCTAAVVIAILAEKLMLVFIADDPEVTRIGVSALHYLCLSMPVLAYSSHVNMLLQCLRRTKSATFLAACRNGVFYMPLMLLLPLFLGLTGIELTQPLADILTCAVSVPFHLRFFRTLRQMEREA